jgi:hypothetical protein
MINTHNTEWFLLFIPLNKVAIKFCFGLSLADALNILFILDSILTFFIPRHEDYIIDLLLALLQLITWFIFDESKKNKRPFCARMANISMTLIFYSKAILLPSNYCKASFLNVAYKSYEYLVLRTVGILNSNALFGFFLIGLVGYYLLMLYFMFILFSYSILMKYLEYEVIEGKSIRLKTFNSSNLLL